MSGSLLSRTLLHVVPKVVAFFNTPASQWTLQTETGKSLCSKNTNNRHIVQALLWIISTLYKSCVWKEWLHCFCSIKPKSESICVFVAEAQTGSVKCFCPVFICVSLCVCFRLFLCMQRERKKDQETEGWSGLQQVEIPFSLPLLFVSTAGLSQD